MIEDTGLFPTAVKDTVVGRSNKENSVSAEIKDELNLLNNNHDTDTKVQSNEEIITTEEASCESNDVISIHTEGNLPRDTILKDKLTDPIVKNMKQKPKYSKENNKKVPKTPNPRLYKTKKPQSVDQARKQKRTMNYREVHEGIPKNVKNNPYIMKRLNTVPENPLKPPRAALPPEQYRPKQEIVLDDFTKAILEKKPIDTEPTIEQLQASSYQLRNLERDLVEKSNYYDAKKAAEAHDYIQAKLKRETEIKDGKATIEDLISKRNELMALVEHLNSHYQQLINDHEAEFSQRAAQMREEQQTEIEKFDEQTPSELQPEFRRYSVTLLKLRSEEKNLALNRKFDEAIAKKEKADKLQKQEEQQNIEKMNDYYNCKKERLMEKHNKVLKTFTQLNETRLNEILGQRKKKIEPLQARIEIYEKLIDDLCEKHNIKASHLNFDTIDDERVERLKTTSQSSSAPFTRAQSALSKSMTKSNPVVKPKISSQTK